MEGRCVRMGRHVLLLSVSAAAMSGFLAPPALAQDEVEEVVITGSRTIRDGSTAPTPVSVLSIEQLQNAAPRNIAESLQSLPALRGSSTSNTTAASGSRNFTGSFMSLRNLGSNRTLVLLDGRRVAPAAVDGSVDVNLLPQGLIKRVDIVTGGASAAYGSDAVAGVVNFVLDEAFVGVKGLVQAGISDKGDAGNSLARLSYGSSLFDDRLRILVSGEISRADPVFSALHRSWAIKRLTSVRATSLIADRPGIVPVYPGTAAASAFYNTSGLVNINYTGGLITFDSQPTNGTTPSPILAAFGISAKTNFTATALGAPGLGYKILPNGEGSPYSYGAYTAAAQQFGGDGVPAALLGSTALLERKQVFGRSTFDLSDSVSLFAESAYSKAHNRYFIFDSATTVGALSLTIFEDNVFLQQQAPDAYSRLTGITGAAATTLITGSSGCNSLANGGPTGQRCFRMARSNHDLPETYGNVDNTAINFTAGFNAELWEDWRLSGYYNHGTTESAISYTGDIYYQRYFAAIDAIANPAVGGVSGIAVGTPVCGILVYGSAAAKAKYAGCKPANIFGVGHISQESMDWFQQSPGSQIDVSQDVVALDLAAEPFNLPAGAIGVAFGVEHREVKTSVSGGEPLSAEVRANDGIRGYPAGQAGQEGVFVFNPAKSYGGTSKVDEAYAEINLPLLKNVLLAQDLSLNGAYRYTDYSLSGPVKTWKVGASYSPLESVRFRGTLSHDIRAPSISELFLGAFTAGFGFSDIAQTPNTTTTSNQSRVRTVGNPNLVPEEADTKTYGVVFTPTWISGLTASVDYYDIKIEGGIATEAQNDPIVNCVINRIQSACDAIQRVGNVPTPLGGSDGPLPQIQIVTVAYQNLSVQRSKGIDVELSYRRSIDPIPGQFSMRTIWGYLIENYAILKPGQPRRDAVGDVAGATNSAANPRFRAVTTIGWANGPLELTLTNRYTSSANSATYSPASVRFVEGVNIDNNRVPSYTLWDVSARYRFGEDEQYEAFLVVNNLLDPPPPEHTAPVSTYPTNGSLYDAIGRSYVTGLKFRF